MPIPVLGPVHSGTSLVTELLARAGVRMGVNVPDKSSRKYRSWDGTYKHFEDQRMVGLSRALTMAAGGDWRHLPSPDRLDSVFGMMERSMRAAIRYRANGGEPWGWKDPQLCYTGRLWHKLLKDPVYIFIDRDLDAIARSKHRELPNEPIERIRRWIVVIRDQMYRFLDSLPATVPRKLLRLEELSMHPEREVRALFGFLQMKVDVKELAGIIE